PPLGDHPWAPLLPAGSRAAPPGVGTGSAGRTTGDTAGPSVRDMIEAKSLTRKYGERLAVDRLSFTVRPGRVTGFLGPNGAGKSTTLRLILRLDTPTGGTVTIDGRPYQQ